MREMGFKGTLWNKEEVFADGMPLAPVESGSTQRTISRQMWWSVPEWVQMVGITRKKVSKVRQWLRSELNATGRNAFRRYDLITHPLSLELTCWLIPCQRVLYALYASTMKFMVPCDVESATREPTQRQIVEILPSAFLRVNQWWQVPAGEITCA